jgi:CheY-like chemotaxis protein
VDDDMDTAELMADGLSLLGHDTKVAADGDSALELAAVFEPETVVLDLGLAGSMDGYALAAHLRRCGRPIRVIVVSGYGREDDLRRSEAEGIDAHLVKPVDFDVLASTVCPAEGNKKAC